MLKIFASFLVSTVAMLATAQDYNDHKDFDNYSVYYTFFDSTFVKPDIAKAHGIKRSKYEMLMNVSISPKGEYGALPGRVTGTVTNLMQQQKVLDFKEIKEATATYYIAPIRVNNKEVVHIALQVIPEGSEEPLEIKFSKTIYAQ